MKTTPKASLYRQLPSVDQLLHSPEFAPLLEQLGPAAVKDTARAVLADLRVQIATGKLRAKALTALLPTLGDVVSKRAQSALSYSLVPVINATGVILHTNLGRAPLSAEALQHIRETSGSYSNLEFEIAAGERGARDIHVDRLFARLLQGASPSTQISTIVVNNNAAAVLLALNTLAEGGEVIASRGELIEIGGSFRIPDIMAKSNATLHEVGTTNRTRVSDYKKAINEKTRLLLRVHRSNFEMAGFTEQPRLEELVALSRESGIPLLEDLGSGRLCDLPGLEDDPGVTDSLRAGVDIVAYSGDKLLGGPQAGMLSGRSDLIARMRSNPLFRALRVDKLTYAALETTLLAYLRRDFDAIPILRMMRFSRAEIRKRAEAVRIACQPATLRIELRDGESAIGGGAGPSAALPTCLLVLSLPGVTASEVAARLRALTPPVIARVEQDRVLLDLRTVLPEQDATLARALFQIAEAGSSQPAHSPAKDQA